MTSLLYEWNCVVKKDVFSAQSDKWKSDESFSLQQALVLLHFPLHLVASFEIVFRMMSAHIYCASCSAQFLILGTRNAIHRERHSQSLIQHYRTTIERCKGSFLAMASTYADSGVISIAHARFLVHWFLFSCVLSWRLSDIPFLPVNERLNQLIRSCSILIHNKRTVTHRIWSFDWPHFCVHLTSSHRRKGNKQTALFFLRSVCFH